MNFGSIASGLSTGGWSSIFGSIGNGGSTTSNNIPAPTAEERQLTALNAQLAQKQLDQINSLQPFQQQLVQSAQADLARTGKLNAALDAAISPEDQAAAQAQQFKNANALGPMQVELAQMQLDALKNGGKATPEQIQQIAQATDASIAAGTNDINTQTKRGIGLISDELANSRGLRLSDSPIGSEAALLARAGNDQIGSLTTNLRANQANAVLNYPLAVQGLQGGINTNQQSLNQNAEQFQNQLRQQAYTNRLAMTGQAQSGGIGLAGIGSGGAALNSLTNARIASGSTDFSKKFGLADFASLAGGIGGAMSGYRASDPRLKTDFGVVGETRSGIKIHAYRYKHETHEDPLRLGVMADEVKKILPNAVARHPSGFDMVDYGQVR